MSISSVFCALTLAFQLLFSKTVQDKDASKLSGVFTVFVETDFGPAGCHDCIVRAVGITQIHLLESNAEFRLYRVEGHQDIANSYFWHCGTRTLCKAPLERSQSYWAVILRAMGHSRILHPAIAIESERSIYQWAYKLNSENLMTLGPFEQSTQHWPEFLTKQEVDNSLFFDKEEKLSPPWTTKSVRDRLQTKAMSHQGGVDVSLRRILIVDKEKEAVCMECFALHSIWLAIRTY